MRYHVKGPCGVIAVGNWSGLGQGENGIISGLDMSGEMHMRRRNEVFSCIPHGRGAQAGAGNR